MHKHYQHPIKSDDYDEQQCFWPPAYSAWYGRTLHVFVTAAVFALLFRLFSTASVIAACTSKYSFSCSLKHHEYREFTPVKPQKPLKLLACTRMICSEMNVLFQNTHGSQNLLRMTYFPCWSYIFSLVLATDATPTTTVHSTTDLCLQCVQW